MDEMDVTAAESEDSRSTVTAAESEDSRSTETPKEKEDAIIEAFRHFQMI